eukprot:s2168_g16.t1
MFVLSMGVDQTECTDLASMMATFNIFAAVDLCVGGVLGELAEVGLEHEHTADCFRIAWRNLAWRNVPLAKAVMELNLNLGDLTPPCTSTATLSVTSTAVCRWEMKCGKTFSSVKCPYYAGNVGYRATVQDTHSDTFDIYRNPNEPNNALCVQRLDGSRWGMKLEIACEVGLPLGLRLHQ